MLYFNLIIIIILTISSILLLCSISTKEHFGPYMDAACSENDCSTPEGINKSIEQCQKKFKSLTNYNQFDKACSSNDPDILANACPETCDPKLISPFLLTPKVSN